MDCSKLPASMLLVLATVALPACSKPAPAADRDQPKAAEAPAAVAAQPVVAEDGSLKAKEMFKSRCSVCHGTGGKGDGPGAAALKPKPRDYTSADWQKSVTDEDIKNTIVMGGAAIGKSPAMPASPDLQTKPEVLEALVKIVRSYAK